MPSWLETVDRWKGPEVMGVHAVRGRISDSAHSLWWRISDGWSWLRSASRKTQLAAVALVAAVAVIVCAAVLVVLGEEAESVDDGTLADVIVQNVDLPATAWTGWSTQPMARPKVAAPAEGMTARPADCVPGGPPQQRAQALSVSGSRWAGVEFTNVAMGARATTMIARNDLNVGVGVDGWVASCGHAIATEGSTRASVDLKAIGIDPTTYRLDTARLIAQSVTPQVANAEVASTNLIAVGRTGGYVITVSLAFAGPLTEDAITTLETLWRAQAAKLVGYQQAGLL